MGTIYSVFLGYLYYPNKYDSKIFINKLESIKNEKDILEAIQYVSNKCKNTDELQSIIYSSILDNGLSENALININKITKRNSNTHDKINYACIQLWSSIILAESQSRPSSIVKL